MDIETKFAVGQEVRRKGTRDIGKIRELNINVDIDGEISIACAVHHCKYDNPHVAVDFFWEADETEYEAV